MRNLINFIAKYHFFFLFLFLQVIAFYLLFQSSQYHRSFWISSSNNLTGKLYEKHSNAEDYFFLQTINNQLVEENEALIKQTPFSFLKSDQKIFHHQDTLYKRQYTYVNAKVINNSINRRNNYLTLNKGRYHGIEPGMGVITSKGVIGIVKDVSSQYSSVLSLLHMDSHISAKIMKNDHLGSIIWNSPDYRQVLMKYIPPHVEIMTGDTIITSGFSKIFPEGVMIGTVSEHYIKRGENFLTLQVELFEDFNNLTYVYVVKNLFRDEQEKLEHRSETESIYW